MNRKRILLIYYIILIIESKLINNNINKVYSLTKSKISSLNIQEIQQNKQNNENNLIIKLGKRIKDTIKSFYSPKKVQISSNLLISGMNRRNMRISQVCFLFFLIYFHSFIEFFIEFIYLFIYQGIKIIYS